MKKLIVIMGPSGSGKTTLEKSLVETGDFDRIISTTTRPMREGEVNGDSYFFVTEEEYQNTELIESVEFCGNKYGASVDELMKSNKDCVFVATPGGFKQIETYIREKNLPVTIVSVYLNIPEEVCLSNMIDKRGDDKEKALKRAVEDDIRKEFEFLEIEPRIQFNQCFVDTTQKLIEAIPIVTMGHVTFNVGA